MYSDMCCIVRMQEHIDCIVVWKQHHVTEEQQLYSLRSVATACIWPHGAIYSVFLWLDRGSKYYFYLEMTIS